MVKVKAITPEDRIEARHKDLSEEPDQEWQNPSYEVETGEEGDDLFAGWDFIPEDERPPGVVASDPVVWLKKRRNWTSTSSRRQRHFLWSRRGESTTARGDPGPMDVDEQCGWKLGPRRQDGEELWGIVRKGRKPDNMAGVPNRSAISHSMSDYLRGHRMFHRRPSPEIRRSNLSIDFNSLVRHLQGDYICKNRRYIWRGSAFKWLVCRMVASSGHPWGFVQSRGIRTFWFKRAAWRRSSAPCTRLTRTSTSAKWMTPRCTHASLRCRKARQFGMTFHESFTMRAIMQPFCRSSPMAWSPAGFPTQRGGGTTSSTEPPVKGRDEAAPGDVSREGEAYRHFVRYWTADAIWYQIVRHWRGNCVPWLGDKHGTDERIWHAQRWVIREPGLRHTPQSLSQAILKEAKEHYDPTDDLLSKMMIYLADAELNF